MIEEILILAVTAAAISNMLDDFMSPDMIFDRYGNWVRSLGWWGKPLGGCLVCMNVWVAVVLYFLPPCIALDAISFIAYSHLIIKFIIRYG